MIRVGISPLIILINNSGYAIEEEIHAGPYNKISDWNYTAVVEGMAGSSKNLYTAKVRLHLFAAQACLLLSSACYSLSGQTSAKADASRAIWKSYSVPKSSMCLH